MLYNGQKVIYKNYSNFEMGIADPVEGVKVIDPYNPSLLVYESLAEAVADRKGYFGWRMVDEISNNYPEVKEISGGWVVKALVETDTTIKASFKNAVDKQKRAIAVLNTYTTIAQVMALTWENA